MSEIPRKKLSGRERPAKQPSCNDFCRVCSVNFKTNYGECNQNRVSTENLFEEPKGTGVESCLLATCFKNSDLRARKACLSQTECVQNVPRKHYVMLFT